RLITTQPSIVSRWLTSANSASNLVEPQSVMTFASPSADCGACWSSMRFMIAERQDESIAAPWTSAHAAVSAHDGAESPRPSLLSVTTALSGRSLAYRSVLEARRTDLGRSARTPMGGIGTPQ